MGDTVPKTSFSSGDGESKFKAIFQNAESLSKIKQDALMGAGENVGKGSGNKQSFSPSSEQINQILQEAEKIAGNGEPMSMEQTNSALDAVNKLLDMMNPSKSNDGNPQDGEGQDQNQQQDQQSQGKQRQQQQQQTNDFMNEIKQRMQNLLRELERRSKATAEAANKTIAETAASQKKELRELLEENRKKILDEAKEAAKQVAAPKIEISLGGDADKPTKVLQEEDIVHVQYERALKILDSLGILWLCGEAGCGKTHLAGQLAKAYGLPFYAISCTAGLSESYFIGRRDLNGEYLTPQFLHLYENGGVVLLDEYDASDSNTNLITNSAMGNGYLSVPLRTEKPMAYRHKNFKIIWATNTWGLGPDGQYTGREGLDASTRDRAVIAKIRMSYSRQVEAAFLKPSSVPLKVNDFRAYNTGNANLADIFYTIRTNIGKHNLRRIMSTRAFEQAAKLKASGFSDGEILAIYFSDWTQTEKDKALAGVAIS